jgi:tetratricopeptide (TPR) repeat protein
MTEHRVKQPVLVMAFLAAMVVWQVGCAVSTTSGSRDAALRLSELANEDRAVDTRSTSAPMPEGLDAEALSLVSAEDELAHLSVDAAIARFGSDGESDNTIKVDADREPNPEALLSYIAGRSRRLQGDLQGALQDLEAAAKADPSAPEPWRELGQTHRQLGDRLSAAAAFRQALRRDPEDVASLLQLGLWSQQRRDVEKAVNFLSRARQLALTVSDPALPIILDFNLGRSLVEIGALRAGVELIVTALDMPMARDTPSMFQYELQTLVRVRGDGWRDAGDAAIRLGDYSTAVDAYEQVLRLPSLDSGGVLTRYVYASMKASRPARAAEAVLTALSTGSDLSGKRLLPLIQYIGEWSDLGSLLRRAIDQRRAELSPKDAIRLGSLYARAAASALSHDAAIDALSEWLSTHPTDVGAVRDLFGLVGDDPRAMVDATIRLIERAPLNDARYATVLLDSMPSVEAALEQTKERRSDSAAMLRARLLEQTGRINDAAESLAPIVASRSNAKALVSSYIELLSKLGRTVEAQQYLDRLTVGSNAVDRIYRARALAAMSQGDEALEVLLHALMSNGDAPAPLAGDPNELTAVMLAAGLAWNVGDADAVAMWSRRAIELNPALEQPYARLIELYDRNGPLPDSNKLAEVVRELRAAAPSSRTLRWLRAQELVAGGQYDQALRGLTSLAQENLTHPVVDLLTTIWLRTGSADKAESWLRAQMESHPTSAIPVRALARVLAEDEQGELAVTMLQEWIDARPYDFDSARQMEEILRTKLDRVQEADRHALARLDQQPATFARAVELAPVLISLKEASRGAEELLATADSPQVKSSTLAQPFIRDVFLLGQEAINGALEIEPAIKLHAIIFKQFPQLPVEVHDNHLHLLAKAEASYEDTVSVFEYAITHLPQRSSELAGITVQRLLSFGQNELALRLAERAGELIQSPNEVFFARWVQAASVQTNLKGARHALRAIASSGKASKVLASFGSQRPSEGDRANADVVLLMATTFEQNGASFEDIVSLYDLALEFDPRHETVNNNYGYLLAEHGERLDEAEQLVLRALSIRPNDSFATDSLGWVRYKQGVIADEHAANGKMIREGAVSILQRAVQLAGNRNSADVHDHLGDALWALGDKTRATGRWQVAQSLIEDAIVKNTAPPNYPEMLEKVKAKLTQALSGGDPAIAVILGPLNIENQ